MSRQQRPVKPASHSTDISLGYEFARQRVCWQFMSVLEYTEDGFWGERLLLDATSGEELVRATDRYERPEY